MKNQQRFYTLVCLSFAMILIVSQCGGGSNIDLDGETSNFNDPDHDPGSSGDTSLNLSTETVEDSEIVQTIETGAEDENNSDVVVDAPEIGYITDSLVFIDCSTKTAEGDIEADYVVLTCSAGDNETIYTYYCLTSIDDEDNEVFVVTRDAEELYQTILVTCEENDSGEPEFFEEEYIVS